MGCTYLSIPEIPASGAEILILTQCCKKVMIKAICKHEKTINHIFVCRVISPLWSKCQNILVSNHAAMQNKEHSRTDNQDANFVDTRADTKTKLALWQLSVFNSGWYYIHRLNTLRQKTPLHFAYHFHICQMSTLRNYDNISQVSSWFKGSIIFFTTWI